jgi:hypothetical protein
MNNLSGDKPIFTKHCQFFARNVMKVVISPGQDLAGLDKYRNCAIIIDLSPTGREYFYPSKGEEAYSVLQQLKDQGFYSQEQHAQVLEHLNRLVDIDKMHEAERKA